MLTLYKRQIAEVWEIGRESLSQSGYVMLFARITSVGWMSMFVFS
ncbi:Uncharacterised protein [Streptococcus pyogenes]|nr:Uncharacterised protein [Streptococcus pyogenes]